MPLEEADDAKLARISSAFEPYAPHLSPAAAIVRVGDLGYRNRARMVVQNGRLGLYEADSRDVVVIKRCLVHRPEIEDALDVARRHLVAAPLRDVATHIDARIGHDSGVLTIMVSSGGPDVIGAARALAAELPDWGISINVAEGSSAVVLSGETIEVAPPSAPTMKVGDLELEAPPSAFYQVNDSILERAHDSMREMLPADLPIVDAYCGVGTHGLALGNGREVHGFDSSLEAIEAARRNADRSGIDGTFHHLPDTDVGQFPWPEDPCVTIANPARAGVTHEFIDVVANSPTTHLLYLSCEPETLARDIERLRRRGFAQGRIVAFDMMPRTTHVETLVELYRSEVPDRDYETAYDISKKLPAGVSGPFWKGEPTRSIWFARVVGKAPNGSPPHMKGGTSSIDVRRLRNVGDQSIVRIEADGADPSEMRQRLRRWGHPIVGDADEGIPAINAVMARREWLDRPALHAVRVETEDEAFDAPVPAELRRFFKLPDHLLQP